MLVRSGNMGGVDSEELSAAATELISEDWIGPGRIDDEARLRWTEQLRLLLEDVVAHTELWCILPAATSDRFPPDVDQLPGALAFLDSHALYRVVPWISKRSIGFRTERIPFESFRHVIVTDTRYHGSARERRWQFRTEGDALNQGASEGGMRTRRTNEFLHELARRLGWPLPG
jgi:hypothetical protein